MRGLFCPALALDMTLPDRDLPEPHAASNAIGPARDIVAARVFGQPVPAPHMVRFLLSTGRAMPDEPKPSLYVRLKDRFVPSKREIFHKLAGVVRWSDRKVPHGVRTALGIPLIIGGILSFLPVLGLWMLPAGAALVALDFPGTRRRLLHWIDRKEAEYAAADPAPTADD